METNTGDELATHIVKHLLCARDSECNEIALGPRAPPVQVSQDIVRRLHFNDISIQEVELAGVDETFFPISVRDGEAVGDVEKERKSRRKEASGVDLMGLFDKVKRSKKVCKPQIGKTKDVKIVEGGRHPLEALGIIQGDCADEELLAVVPELVDYADELATTIAEGMAAGDEEAELVEQNEAENEEVEAESDVDIGSMEDLPALLHTLSTVEKQIFTFYDDSVVPNKPMGFIRHMQARHLQASELQHT